VYVILNVIPTIPSDASKVVQSVSGMAFEVQIKNSLAF